MAQKCVHTGCGKSYTDPDETCRYHPGPPIFHEGQKGWKCCKPRVLTFDEFLAITPCTDGKHSTTDLPPQVEKKSQEVDPALLAVTSAAPTPGAASEPPPRAPIAAPQTPAGPTPPPPESEDDDPGLEIPDGAVCRRKTCGAKHARGTARDGEKCTHHPGVPVFHEGSKGYSCCKRRVLEFDQFLKIEGCKTKDRHLFVGSGADKKGRDDGGAKSTGVAGGEELLETVRTDFYQTARSVIASFYLKKIAKDVATVEFTARSIRLDLPTTDSPRPKRYRVEVPLYAPIDPAASAHKILGTKLEVTLAKADGSSWPVLRSDDRLTGEILQVGRAGKA